MRVHLKIKRAGIERVVTLEGDRPVVIGRSTTCDVTIPDQRISRRHFRIEFPAHNRADIVEDPDVKNGTFVDGRRIERSATLKDGDEILIGETTIGVRMEPSTDVVIPPTNPSTRYPADATMDVLPPASRQGGAPAIGGPARASLPPPAPKSPAVPPPAFLPGGADVDAARARAKRESRDSRDPDEAAAPARPGHGGPGEQSVHGRASAFPPEPSAPGAAGYGAGPGASAYVPPALPSVPPPPPGPLPGAGREPPSQPALPPGHKPWAPAPGAGMAPPSSSRGQSGIGMPPGVSSSASAPPPFASPFASGTPVWPPPAAPPQSPYAPQPGAPPQSPYAPQPGGALPGYLHSSSPGFPVPPPVPAAPPPPPAPPAVPAPPTPPGVAAPGAYVSTSTPGSLRRPPLHVPGYQLDRLLKRTDPSPSGIFVSIYVAFSDRGGEEVVLKVVEGASPGSPPLAVFERGARTWAALRHRRIVRLIEDGCRINPPFLATAYAARGSLDRELARAGGRLLPSEALRAFVHIAEALEELGRRSIVHRAIQPSNILIGADGGYLLNDFLLAKEITPAEMQLTRLGRVKGGDERYMPPEQLRGGDVGPRADIYALGAVFYHLLCGTAPHEKLVEANREWLGHLGGLLQEAPPTPLPDMRWHDYGDRIAEILRHALEPNLDRRYRSATELMNDLRAIGEA